MPRMIFRSHDGRAEIFAFDLDPSEVRGDVLVDLTDLQVANLHVKTAEHLQGYIQRMGEKKVAVDSWVDAPCSAEP